MSLTRNILDWCDEKETDILINYENEKHPLAKIFGIGIIEGVVDAVITMSPFIVGGLLITALAKK